MPKPLPFELSAEQRRELVQARDHHYLPHVREKAAAILKIAQGQSGRDVAFHGLLRPRCTDIADVHQPQAPWRCTDTVYRWVHRYLAAGLAGLLVRSGRGTAIPPFPQHPDAACGPKRTVARRAP